MTIAPTDSSAASRGKASRRPFSMFGRKRVQPVRPVQGQDRYAVLDRLEQIGHGRLTLDGWEGGNPATTALPVLGKQAQWRIAVVMAECATLFRPTARLRQRFPSGGKVVWPFWPGGRALCRQRELAKGFFASVRPNMRLHAASRKNRCGLAACGVVVAATVSVTRTDGRLGTARSTGPAAGLSFLVAMLFPLALSACRPVRLPRLV